MVFNGTFNNISVISRRSFLLVEETGGPGENYIVLLPGSLYNTHLIYVLLKIRQSVPITTKVVSSNPVHG
jgi:hypothetical protein